jgi:Ca2+-binding EF-hand superfamily protein
MSEKDRKEYFSKIDLDKNGELSFDEFFSSNQRTGQFGRSEEFRQQKKESFSKLDYDHSGQLTFQEYQPVFNEVNCL